MHFLAQRTDCSFTVTSCNVVYACYTEWMCSWHSSTHDHMFTLEQWCIRNIHGRSPRRKKETNHIYEGQSNSKSASLSDAMTLGVICSLLRSKQEVCVFVCFLTAFKIHNSVTFSDLLRLLCTHINVFIENNAKGFTWPITAFFHKIHVK